MYAPLSSNKLPQSERYVRVRIFEMLSTCEEDIFRMELYSTLTTYGPGGYALLSSNPVDSPGLGD